MPRQRKTVVPARDAQTYRHLQAAAKVFDPHRNEVLVINGLEVTT